MYRIFNTALKSTLALPELPEIAQLADSMSPITLRSASRSFTSSEQPKWLNCWYQDAAKTETWMKIARVKGQYLLRFTGLVDFMIDFERFVIRYKPFPDIPVETIRHLLLDQVLPRFMGHLGRLVLHASAVVLPDGSGITFLGKSGWGKSTIASSFHSDGGRLVTDDTLLLDEVNGLLVGIPAYAGSRLWQDSAETIFPDRTDLATVSHYSNKKRLILHDQEDTSPEIAINTIFLLSDPSDKPPRDGISIEPVRGKEAIMAMIGRAFLLDASDMAVVARQFDTASRVTSTNPAVFSLNYPREYHRLADLREAVLEVVYQQRTSNRKAAS